MGRSEPGGEKERELARMATMVIAAGRREGRQANDWRTFNEKTIKQAKTGLFIQNLCETEHPGDYERAGIFILESRRDLGRLYEMAPVRIAVQTQDYERRGGEENNTQKFSCFHVQFTKMQVFCMRSYLNNNEQILPYLGKQ